MVRKIFRTAFKQWRYQFLNMDFWVLMISIGMFFTIYFQKAGVGVRQAGEYVGIFSLFPIGMVDWFIFITIAIGFMFAVTDIPVYTPDSEFKVLRMDRRIWYCAQWMYLFFMVLTYAVFIWLSELLFYLPNWVFTGDWGNAVKSGSALGNEFGSMDVPVGLLERPAIAVFSMGMLLFILLGMLLGGICLVCNMYFMNVRVGISICSLLIILFMAEHLGYISPSMLSPLGVFMGFWELTPATFLAEIGYFAALCILLYMAGQGMLYKIDLKGETKKA